MTFDEVFTMEKEALIPTYARFHVLLDHGKGSQLFDEKGESYLDLTSGIGVNVLGYAHPKLLKAQMEQLQKLTHVSNLYYTEPMVKAAKKLTDASGMHQVFFANSGAEANEGAIKAARKYAATKHSPDKNRIATLSDSFHGRTIATLEATGQDHFHQDFHPYTGGFDYVETGNVEDLKNKITDQTAAIMMEMVQGESGVRPLDPAFVKEIEKIAKEHDALLIVDEVQTGIGRTGTFFSYEQYGLQPDIVTTAKGLGGGLPMGAFLISEKLDGILKPGDHGSTFGGNVLSAATANEVLDIVAKPEFLDDVYRKGNKFMEGLSALDKKDIEEVRGKGLMIGVQVPKEKLAEYIQKLMDKHLLVLKAGSNTIRLLPPLVLNDDQIEEAIAVFDEVIE